jgi:hypothetical protein
MKLQPDTTHLWTPARCGLYTTQLNQYKRDNNAWLVYSPKTGWRKSVNDNEWFAEEAELGYFVERKRDEHG